MTSGAGSLNFKASAHVHAYQSHLPYDAWRDTLILTFLEFFASHKLVSKLVSKL